MFESIMEKERRLEFLAQEDKTYILWKKSYESSAEKFEAFANAQPEKISNFLWCYAEAGRLMQQRKVNLACEYMSFMEK